MNIQVDRFGVLPDGRQALLYTMENNNGMRVQISNLGGIVVSLEAPDKQGNVADVALGHPDFESYLMNKEYFGALVGRNANRIAGAQVEIGGTVHQLERNDGSNNLHSGKNGLSFRLMNAEARTVGSQPVLLLTHTMESGCDGFPGNLTISAVYALTDDNALMIDYRGVSDSDTIINLTNHSYFNLAGHASGPVYDHILQLESSFYMPASEECLPTGEILKTEGSPFDFRKPASLRRGIRSGHEQVQQFNGFDHNFLLDGDGYRRIATVSEPVSGRVMDVFTNLPAVQLYTGNGLGNQVGKGGASYQQHQGFCLETQFAPNAMNMPWLLSPIFRAGEECVTTTGFRFSTL